MTLRALRSPIFTFVLGIVIIAGTFSSNSHSYAQDDRAADREAIRAHIDSIFLDSGK